MPQPHWQFATNYAPAILHCFREDLGGSVQNTACFLLSNGIPLNTCAHHIDLSLGVQNTITQRMYTPHSLGWCHPRYKLGPREYTVYQELQDRVLSCPYCHVALLQGSIVWHLAFDALKFPTDSEISIIQGPLEDALT